MGVFSFLFQSDNARHLKKLNKIAAKVLALDAQYTAMTDDELKACTSALKNRLKGGETLNDILPDAFALVRESAWRVLGMKHFPVQVVGGIVLHQGRIAEMRTGEGKTLVSTLPAYLNALAGDGVHIVTVNDYLAARDAEWMGKVHRFLGLTVGVVLNDMNDDEKRKAYNCDITYATNNALGFDYLRDNMVIDITKRMQRKPYFAIVDEVDSILIDEARTPLIISGQGMKSSEMYEKVHALVRQLKPEDYEIEPKHKTIHLTEAGIEKAERKFGLTTLADFENIELSHHINNALRANFVMKRNEDYLVKDDEVLIVDEFTGRVMQGRRYSNGLHQAIEAKEGVKVKDENKTLATITFQNYFRMYRKLSGMTGTAKTEELEFNNIYGLDVVTIPTNLPTQRKDEPDIIYTKVPGKIRAIVEEIARMHEKGRPVLVGTTTIDKSEELSRALKKEKVPHHVLNAKNHEQESEIVAQAGRKGAVTIATNMAGRGTDILLGGNPEFMSKKQMREEGYTDAQLSYATSFENKELSDEMHGIRERYRSLLHDFKLITDAEKQEVIAAGGLHIIGTERHESRRIDNQLRGRAGRQGDPGSSVFYISLEDDLARRFGGEKMQNIASFFKVDEDTPFQLQMLSKQIELAQKRIEAQNYSARKNVLEYDDVMNTQRDIIYRERNRVLEGVDVHEEIKNYFPDMVSEIVNTYLDADKPYYEWDIKALNTQLEQRLFPRGTNFVTDAMIEDADIEEVLHKVLEDVLARFEHKTELAKKLNFDFSQFERYVLLNIVDHQWMDHIDAMSILKNEIGLRAYGQHNPIDAYKQEGFEMFDTMINRIREDTATILLNVNIEEPPQQKQNIYKPKVEFVQAKPTQTEANAPVEHKQAKSDKVAGRNDPCPCGSGKKFKNCCGE